MRPTRDILEGAGPLDACLDFGRMTWFRVDDKFHDHPKVRKLRGDKLAAAGLWSLAGSWSSDNLTDGFVPTEIVQRFDPEERYAERLVEVGLWLPAERDGETGYTFHQWGERQPTRQSVEDRRVVRAAAGHNGGVRSGQVRRAASSKAEASASSKPEASASQLLEPPTQTQPLPNPTQPQKPKTKKPSPLRAAQGLDRFEEFYAVYPRHIDRKDAERAWSKAIQAHPADQIIDAAKRYADAQQGRDAKFIKYPATWLNKGGYLDEPDLRLVAGDGIHRDPKTGRAVEW